MAVTVSTVLNGSGVPSGGTNATASWTPDGTSQYILTVTGYIATGSTPPVISSVTGNSLTWTQVGSPVSGDNTGADRTIQYMFVAPAGSTATGVVTINWSLAGSKASWTLDKVAGAASSFGAGTLPQAAVSGISSGANPSATLGSALQTGSVTYASACFESSAGTLSAGTGYTALGQNTGQSLAWVFSEWNSAGSTTAAANNSTTTNRHSIILIEIPISTSGSFSVITRQSANSGTTAAATQTTSSATPTANSLFFVCQGQENAAVASAPAYQTPTGGSLTYTSLATAGIAPAYPWNSDDSFRVGNAVYYAPVGSSPSAFAVTVDSYSSTQTGYYATVCFDVTGHDTTTPIVQSTVNGATKAGGNAETGSITLSSTPSTGNLVVVVFTEGADSGGGIATPTAGTGKTFTAVANQTTPNCQTGVFYRLWDGSESTTISCSDLGDAVGNYSAIAFEIKAASTGASADASLSAAVSLSATIGNAISGSASLAETAALSAAATSAKSAVSNLPVTATLTATAATTGGKTIDAALAAATGLTGSVALAKPEDAALSGTASLTGTVTGTKPATGSLSAAASLAATGTQTKPATASLSTTASLTADLTVGTAPKLADAALSVTAGLTAGLTTTKPADAALTVSAVTAGVATGAKSADASLAITETATAAVATGAVAALNEQATLTATGTSTKPAAGSLAATVTLTATLSTAGQQTASAALAETAALTATATSAKPLDGALSVTTTLTAATIRERVAGLSLAPTVAFIAAAVNAKPVSAALPVAAALTADITVQRSMSAQLSAVAVITATGDSFGGVTYRPNTGTTPRPGGGKTIRPFTGTTLRP